MQVFLRVLRLAVPYGFTHNTCRKANITAIAISLPKAISLGLWSKYHCAAIELAVRRIKLALYPYGYNAS